MVTQDIGVLRARLNAAGTVAGTLVVAWDIFDLVQAGASGCADQDPALSAAFLFTAAAAAEGRDAAGFAPSLPDGPGVAIGPLGWATDHQAEFAGQAAELMEALGSRLKLAAGQAAHPGDRRACAHAARQADQVHQLLAPGGR